MKLVPITQLPSASTLYHDVRRASLRLVGTDPEAESLGAFAGFLAARDRFFKALPLPCTGHNALRLYDAICEGWSLEDFLSDVDHFFGDAITYDEGLFLSALATYFSWRGVEDLDGRLYDVEAFLGLTHHIHNNATIAAWLDTRIGFIQLLALTSNDQGFLDTAVV